MFSGAAKSESRRCNQYWGLEASKGSVILTPLLDAETQCSVCVRAYVCGAASVCVVRSRRSYGKRKALVLKEAGVVSGLFSFVPAQFHG